MQEHSLFLTIISKGNRVVVDFPIFQVAETVRASGFPTVTPVLKIHEHPEYMLLSDYPGAYGFQGMSFSFFTPLEHEHPEYLPTDEVAKDAGALGGVVREKFVLLEHDHRQYVPLTQTPERADFIIDNAQYLTPEAIYAGLVHFHKCVTRGSRVSHTETLSTRI